MLFQIESAEHPFTKPRVASHALTVLGRADAMGLLPSHELIQTLDLLSFHRAMSHIHRAGIARNIPFEDTEDLASFEQSLQNLSIALQESPVPQFEWDRLAEVLGIELLGRLLGISPISVRRYRSNARTTPDDVAERLHFLSLITGDLAGAYNEIGTRQWFERKRVQLDGRAPVDFLKGEWHTEQTGPQRVQELARALVASPAT